MCGEIFAVGGGTKIDIKIAPARCFHVSSISTFVLLVCPTPFHGIICGTLNQELPEIFVNTTGITPLDEGATKYLRCVNTREAPKESLCFFSVWRERGARVPSLGFSKGRQINLRGLLLPDTLQELQYTTSTTYYTAMGTRSIFP